jgi:hypothetical protein
MSAEQLLAAIEKVRTAREAVRNLGVNCKGRAEQFTKARSALSLGSGNSRRMHRPRLYGSVKRCSIGKKMTASRSCSARCGCADAMRF